MGSKSKKHLKAVLILVVLLTAAILARPNIALKASELDVKDEEQAESVNTMVEDSAPIILEEAIDDQELPDLRDTLTRQIEPLATRVTLGSRIDELEEDGWAQTPVNEPSYITLRDNNQLRYYFGSKVDIAQNDATGIALGKAVSQGSNQLKLPNVDYIDNQRNGKEKVIPHLFTSKTPGSDTGYGNYTSQGLIVASRESGPRKSSIMYNQAADFKLLEKTINGLTAKKIIYVAKYHDNIYNPNLLVETTMTALPIGQLKIDQEVTNISTQTYRSFMLGYSEDTQLGENDLVPVRTIGDNRGFYIREEQKNQAGIIQGTYRLTYLVSDHDYPGLRGPDNWRGGYWTRYNEKPSSSTTANSGEETFFNFKNLVGITSGRYYYGAFRDLNTTGDEAFNYPAEHLLSANRDSAVSYKNQPVDLAANDSTGFSWVIGIESENNAPEVTVDQAEQLVQQAQEVTVTGRWRDINSPRVSLYYKINDSQQKVIGENIPNPSLNAWQNYNFKLNNEDLKIGPNKVEVYAVNANAETSEVATTTINVQAKVEVVYQTIDGQQITPPTGAPTAFEGLVGTPFDFEQPDLTPDYEFIRVEGATKDGETIEGVFADHNTKVALIYKEIPKEVTLTIQYALKGSTVPLKNIDDNNSPIPNETFSATIGTPISELIGSYKKEIKGYNYDSASNEEGNVPDSDFTVVLYYEGVLSLENVPSVIDFGTNNLISIGTKNISPLANTAVAILDTLENGTSWQLGLRIKQELKTADNTQLKGNLKFRVAGNEPLTLNQNSQRIATKVGNKVGYESIGWDKENEGLFITQEPGNRRDTYKGSIEWTLTDGL